MAGKPAIIQTTSSGEELDAQALALQYGLSLGIGHYAEDPAVTPQSPVSGTGKLGGGALSCRLVPSLHAPVEIGIITAGATERYYPGWRLLTQAGDVWMHGMWEPHGWKVVAPGSERVVVAFLPEFLGEETLRGISWRSIFAAPPQQRPRVSEADRPRVLALAQELREEIEGRSEGWQVAVRLLILQLLHLLSRNWTPPRSAVNKWRAEGNCLGRLMPALTLVGRRHQEKTSLAEAAAACGLGRSQFSAAFRRTLGVSFGQFRLRARLAVAAHQLLTSDQTIGAVAARTGFTDASHLSRAFRKQYGCTPAGYRERGAR